MKLSEAIRLGAMSSHQVFGYMASDDGGSCALGSAYLAAGILSESDFKPDAAPRVLSADEIRTKLPLAVNAQRQLVKCPVCPLGHDSVGFAVIHLNDRHKWTREQIADWVETVEQQIATPTNQSVEAR